MLGGVLYFYAPARLAALVLIGRSPDCPFSQAVRTAEELRSQVQIKDEILKASREVEKDPAGYHLWETPKGRFWMPAGSDFVLPFNLAEQVRKIYGTRETAVRSAIARAALAIVPPPKLSSRAAFAPVTVKPMRPPFAAYVQPVTERVASSVVLR